MKCGRRVRWTRKAAVDCVAVGWATVLFAIAIEVSCVPCGTLLAQDVRGPSPSNDPTVGGPPEHSLRNLDDSVSIAVASTKTDRPFDGQRAFEMLTRLCDLGPRPSGSEGMTRQRALLKEHFEGLGSVVQFQEFTARHPLLDRDVGFSNMVVPLHPDRNVRVLLCAHYDTRPYPDRDPIPGGRRGRFVGANDGASGVAVLAELARHLQDFDRPFGIDVLLLDGEEFVFFERGKYFLGSEYFAKEYVKNPPPHRYRWGVLLDMVGDAKLGIFQERHSMSWPDTRILVQDIWQTATRMGVREFIPQVEYEVQDDHLALRNIAGIPTCDIIDFYYPRPIGHQSYWHTRADTPDKCSPDSLAKVGSVMLEWLKTASVEANSPPPAP